VGERDVTRVAIVDRDGTILDVVRDEETGTISVAFHPDHIRFLAGSIDGLRALQDRGYVLAIATNQPAPAKGQFSASAVHRTNGAMVDRLRDLGIDIAAVEVCMHHPDGAAGGEASLIRTCECRKPKPGMLNAILGRLGGDRAQSWMIGDSTADLEAGRAAGVRTGLVFAPNRCELCPLRAGPSSLRPDAGATLTDLSAAILGHS
jgi:D-glycero-D-manno-heptose 1,7-bisphosphate phosphatase